MKTNHAAYSEDVQACCKQALDQMTLLGMLLLRYVLLNEPIERKELQREFFPQFAIALQDEQINVALKSRIVQQNEKGRMIVTPGYREALQEQLWRRLQGCCSI